MEQIEINCQENSEKLVFTEEQKDEIVDIIGDALNKALEEDENAHLSEIMEASLQVATMLTGCDIFYKVSLQSWRVIHRESYEKFKEIAIKHGMTVGEELFDQILSRIATLFGLKYPPIEMA